MNLLQQMAALLRSEFNKLYNGTKGTEFSRRLGADGTVAKSLATIESERDAAITAAIDNLINGAGPALDTLQELSAALGDDPNFATTISSELALKANAADIGTYTEFEAEFNTGLL